MKKLLQKGFLIAGILLVNLVTKAANFRISNGDISALMLALETTSTNSETDTIYLAYKGLYTFTAPVFDGNSFKAAIVLKEDHLNPLYKVVIFGNGSIIQRDQNTDPFRILSVIGTLELNDIHLKNGKVSLVEGAGIYNAGLLYLNRCTITDHEGASFGGAIFSGLGAYTKLVNCTITACSAAFGSALYFRGGNADVINSTITKNTCWGTTGKNAVATAAASLDNTTIITITNTIIADNKDGNGDYGDVGGALRSGSGNLIGANNDVNSAYFIFSDQVGTKAVPINPMLGALSNHGGLVSTMAILSNASPTYGKATNQFAPLLDQVGTNRLGAASIGSMEFTPSNLAFLKPQIRILNSNNLIPDGTGSFSFPPILINQQSSIENFIVKNNFNGTYMLKLLAKPGVILTGANADDFIVIADTLRNEFAPLSGHAQTAFQVKFAPKTVGTKTATILIPSNDIEHLVYQFTITGEGVNVLPVNLISFTGLATMNGNLLKWQTLTEQNNAEFQIWRTDAKQKPNLIRRINGSGNGSAIKSYQFLDQKPLIGTSYYELKQIDFDGAIKSYGPVVLKNNFQQTDISTFTTAEGIAVNINILFPGKASFVITNTSGRKLFSKELRLSEGQNDILLDKILDRGVYILKIEGAVNKIIKLVK